MTDLLVTRERINELARPITQGSGAMWEARNRIDGLAAIADRLAGEVAALRQQLDEARGEIERLRLDQKVLEGALDGNRIATSEMQRLMEDASTKLWAAEAHNARLLVVYRAAEEFERNFGPMWWAALGAEDERDLTAQSLVLLFDAMKGYRAGIPAEAPREAPMADLIIVEDKTFEKADARWLRLRCATDPDCVLIEVRIEPSAGSDAFVDFLRAGHEQLHAQPAEAPDGERA